MCVVCVCVVCVCGVCVCGVCACGVCACVCVVCVCGFIIDINSMSHYTVILHAFRNLCFCATTTFTFIDLTECM